MNLMRSRAFCGLLLLLLLLPLNMISYDGFLLNPASRGKKKYDGKALMIQETSE